MGQTLKYCVILFISLQPTHKDEHEQGKFENIKQMKVEIWKKYVTMNTQDKCIKDFSYYVGTRWTNSHKEMCKRAGWSGATWIETHKG